MSTLNLAKPGVDYSGGLNHRNSVEGNRRFQRLRASIPCAVSWKDEVFAAEVTNLSHGGALITRAAIIPTKGAQIVVVFQLSQEEIRFKAQAREVTENDQPASFGIEFEESHQEIESKLIRLVDILFPGDHEEAGASINEVSSLLSTQKIEQAIVKRAVEEQVQDADAQDEE